MFSKPARSAFCAAGFAIQGGHSALDDENKVRDVTMKTCYENFVEAQPEGTLANVAGAISVSCVGRIGLEEVRVARSDVSEGPSLTLILTSHTLTPSHLNTLTLVLTLAPSHPHTLTPSHPHIRISRTRTRTVSSHRSHAL